MKMLVKECLLEILNEGLGGSTQISSKPALPVTRPLFTDNVRRSPAQPVQQPRSATPQLREAVKREAGGNKLMESILADTASATLPKMLQNEGRGAPPTPGGVAEQLVANVDPEDLFGEEAASKWASLAFMESPTKK